MADPNYKEHDIVICGHSLGGAVATIVTIQALVLEPFTESERKIKCITFGAPSVGDEKIRKVKK